MAVAAQALAGAAAACEAAWALTPTAAKMARVRPATSVFMRSNFQEMGWNEMQPGLVVSERAGGRLLQLGAVSASGFH